MDAQGQAIPAPAAAPAAHPCRGRDDPGPQREAWRRARAAMEARRERSTPDGILPDINRPWFERCVRIVGVPMRACGLLALSRRRALDVRLQPVDLRSPGIPRAFDGYRILHITDPHFDALEGTAEAVLRAVAGVRVDLCALTGDYRAADDGPSTPKAVFDALRAIRHAVAAPDGFLTTLGNHDTHRMIEPLEALGFNVLVNDTVVLTRGRQRLSIAGVDDVHRFFAPSALHALRRHEPFDDDHAGLVLVHSPELAAEAAGAGYALYLCGHTHGGQVSLPNGRPVLCPLVRNHGYARGVWRHDGMVGYTGRGAGIAGLPLRLFSPPEVALIRLVRDVADR